MNKSKASNSKRLHVSYRNSIIAKNNSKSPKNNFLGRPLEPVKRGKERFWPVATGVIGLSALSIVAITPPITQAMKAHSAYAADRGVQLERSDTRRAIAYYQVATFLDPGSQSYSRLLSDAYLKQGMVSKALDALGQTNGQEDQAAKLLLKLDRPDEAVSILQTKVQKAPSGESYLLLARAYLDKSAYKNAETAAGRAEEYDNAKDRGVVYGVIAVKLQGRQNITHASVTSQDAARMIKAAKEGKTPLAQVLYDLGLLRSSQKVLESLSSQSATSFHLRAQIKLAQSPSSQQNLNDAAELLKQALILAPQNIALHRQLSGVYTAMGRNTASAEQTALIKLLENGTP